MRDSNADLWQLPTRLQSLVEAELDSGEKITWIGAPIARRMAAKSLPIVLFAIPWTAFALFWMAGAAGFRMPDLTNLPRLAFSLFGIPFVLIGFGMLSAPYWMMRKAKKTAYVLTTARAIIFSGGFSTTVRSFAPDRLTDLQRKQRADGSGDLVFERTLSYNNDGGRRTTDVGFLAIPDVKGVEDRVRQLAAGSAKDNA